MSIRVLRYLEVTRERERSLGQNCGWTAPYWGGHADGRDGLSDPAGGPSSKRGFAESEATWHDGGPVRGCRSFIVQNGPVTQQDRWEEDAGYSPFTLAAEIAALLGAADIADLVGEKAIGAYLRKTADTWNENIERWIYTSGNDVCTLLEIEGYYVRIAPPDSDGAASPLQGFVPIKNRPLEHGQQLAVHVVSPDALALVRFGLRAADDPKILNTIKVIDTVLRRDLPQGPCWLRYNEDGYGEHTDGSPFDGTGIGRPWPLLAGERAHYELAAGRPAAAEALLRVMEDSTGEGGLIPEQVWDGDDLPALELFRGKSTGSARPLVWAHSEYIKLRRSLRDGKIFDQAPQPLQRYVVGKKLSEFFGWRFNNKPRTMPRGKNLRIILLNEGTGPLEH